MNLHKSKELPPDSLHEMLFARKLAGNSLATSTGYPCILENSVGKPATDYKIYGNSVQNGTPSPDSPVEVQSVGERTKNLFNLSDFKNNITLDVTTGLPIEYAERCGITKPIKITGSSFVLTYEAQNTADTRYIYSLLDADMNLIFRKNNMVSGDVIELQNAKYVYICFYKNSRNLITTDELAKVQFELSTVPTDYEPYGYKIPVVTVNQSHTLVTTNIYLPEPLRKIGDYADVLNFKNNAVTRKIKKVTFDGSEDWKREYLNKPDLEKRYAIGISLFDIHISSIVTNIFCDRYITNNTSSASSTDVSSVRVGIQTNNIWFFINFDELTGEKTTDTTEILNAWKQKLFENPVTVWYVLADEETENVNITEIPTFNGTTAITTNTEIQPSEIEITYKRRNK